MSPGKLKSLLVKNHCLMILEEPVMYFLLTLGLSAVHEPSALFLGKLQAGKLKTLLFGLQTVKEVTVVDDPA